MVTRRKRGDSLDPELADDERQGASGTASASSSSWRMGLRVKPTTGGPRPHSPTRPPGETSEEEGQEEEEEETGYGEEGGKGGGSGRWSTQATGRPTWRHDAELRRMMREAQEELARRHAIYWPGRVDHVRVCRPEGERGGHPVFERVGQTWFNDDPRYVVDKPRRGGDEDDDVVNRFHCSQQQQQQPGWTWQRRVEYRVVGPSAIYRCIKISDSADRGRRTDDFS